jgi:hypothetical protein
VLKAVLWLLAAIAFGVGAYSWRLATTSYSSYSAEQLEMFARELQTLQASDAGATLDDKVVAAMASAELSRRERVRISLVAGLVLIAIALVAPRWSFPSRGSGSEGERLKDFVGPLPVATPGAPAMDKYRAAEALGVRMDASPAVIEAAFEALLKERDPKRRDGLMPDLQRQMDEQLRQLHEARRVLLGK